MVRVDLVENCAVLRVRLVEVAKGEEAGSIRGESEVKIADASFLFGTGFQKDKTQQPQGGSSKQNKDADAIHAANSRESM